MENRGNRTAAIFGIILVTLGVITLIGQFTTNSPLWGAGLTFALGMVFFAGAVAGGRTFSVMAIPGAVLTILGLANAIQILFPGLEVGFYGWALVVAAVGLGMVIFGRLAGSPDLERGGWGVARAGLVFFLVIGIGIELFFTFTGISTGPRSLLWPVVLILTGVVTLLWRLFRLAQSGALLGGEPAYSPEPVEETPVIIEPGSDRAAYRAERRAARRAARREWRNADLFGPVLWIGFGILWLQLSLSMLSFTRMMSLLSLWPVLLIVAGISVLFGRRQPLINLLLGLALVAGAFYAVNNADQLGLTGRSPWLVMGINIDSDQAITERVTGSGSIKTETRQVSDFKGIVLNGGGEVTIVKGAAAGLTIESDDNLLPYLTSEVREGRLYLGLKQGVGITPTRLRYTITLTSLDYLAVNGAATVKSESLEGQDLNIFISGFGALELPKLAYDSINIQLSGSGSVSAAGQTGELDVQISGAGGFSGADLRSQDVNVQISGAGRATVWAIDSLKTSISGMGSVGYYGDPSLNKTTGGLGIIRSLGGK